MSLNNDKYKKSEFCTKGYIRACTALIPKQMFLEVKKELEEQVELTQKSLDTEKIVQDLQNRLQQLINEVPISEDVDDSALLAYQTRMQEDLQSIVNITENNQIKQILNDHPLVKLSNSDLKYFFARQEYLLTENDSFGPFGNAFYQLAHEDAETISQAANASDQPEFWAWIADVNVWLQHLSQWQKDVTTTFKNWDPAQSNSLETLKTSLEQLNQPGSPPLSAPTILKGKII